MVKIGQYNTLRVSKFVDFGLYLDDEDGGEILLPRKYIPKDINIDDMLKVFIYADSDDTIIATTLTPHACVGEAAYLRVAAVNNIGAFLDWGLAKDVLVPFAEQHRKMEVGRSYIVFLYIDKYADRVVASSKINKFIKDTVPDNDKPFKEKQAIDLIIAGKTDIGYKAIINNSYFGVLYEADVFQKITFGQKITGFIKTIREDNKIDLTLQLNNQNSRDSLADKILRHLKNNNGELTITDKSKPEDIYKLFSVSKSNYKKALGGLYKKRLITISKDKVQLV